MLKMTGKRTEPKRVDLAPRPDEQHVERVGEQELRHDEVGASRRPAASTSPNTASTDACAQACR